MAMCSRVLCASGSASATRLDEPPRVRPPSKSPPKWKLLSGFGSASRLSRTPFGKAAGRERTPERRRVERMRSLENEGMMTGGG
jgi:hypothetical protein